VSHCRTGLQFLQPVQGMLSVYPATVVSRAMLTSKVETFTNGSRPPSSGPLLPSATLNHHTVIHANGNTRMLSPTGNLRRLPVVPPCAAAAV